MPVPDCEISLRLGDVFDNIPAHLVRPGHHDRGQLINLRLAELFPHLARGRAAIALSSIARECPDIFRTAVSSLEDRDIAVPLQKIIGQIGAFQREIHAANGSIAPAAEEDESVPEEEPPFVPPELAGISEPFESVPIPDADESLEPENPPDLHAALKSPFSAVPAPETPPLAEEPARESLRAFFVEVPAELPPIIEPELAPEISVEPMETPETPPVLTGEPPHEPEAPSAPEPATVFAFPPTFRPPAVLPPRSHVSPEATAPPSELMSPPETAAAQPFAIPFDQARLRSIFDRNETFDALAVASAVRHLEHVLASHVRVAGEEYESGDPPDEMTADGIRSLRERLSNDGAAPATVRESTMRREETSLTLFATAGASICVAHRVAELPEATRQKIRDAVSALTETP